MTSHASRDMTQHKQSHRIKWRDHYIKWHDMTWHAMSQLTTVAHPTSPHNQPPPTTLLHLTPQATSWHQNRSHYHHGTAESSFTAKKWFGHCAGRSHRQILSLLYTFFSFETSAPGSPGNYLYDMIWLDWILFVSHSSTVLLLLLTQLIRWAW